MPYTKGLDKTRVVQAAAELLNQEGDQALSLGRLAERLGVRTPSLYNHIAGLPGLQRELALLNTRLLGDRLGGAAIGKSGAQAIKAIANAYRDYIKEYPGLYLASLRAARNLDTPDLELEQAEDRVVQTVLVVLAGFGLNAEDGIHAARGLRSLVHGFASLEVAGGFGLPIDCDESFRRLVDIWVQGLSQNTQLGQPLAT